MESVIKDKIIKAVIENGGAVAGTIILSSIIMTNKTWTVYCARELEKKGMLVILPSRGGRGCRTIYRSTTARKLRNERH